MAVFLATPAPFSRNHWNLKRGQLRGRAVVLGDDEQGDERHQHQRRTEHGVEEELQRRVLTILAAPHTDHEVHRQQHELEEDEEQDQVLSDERAGHPGLQHQHQDEERLRVARCGHVIPRVDHHQQGDDHRQHVQRQADAVEADRVGRSDRADPARRGEELLLARLPVVELHQRVDADEHRGCRRDDGGAFDQGLFSPRDEQHHQHAGQRQERADAQQPIVGLGVLPWVPLAVDEYEYERADGCGAEQQRAVHADLA